MQYKITDIKTVKQNSFLFVEVDFYESGRVIHKNSFQMQIFPTYTYYDGAYDQDGNPTEFDNPRAFKTEDTNVVTAINENIKSYIKRKDFQNTRLDERDSVIEKEDTNPLGLRTPAVEALVDLSQGG